MDNLIELGYLGLFIASFLGSTILPLSSDIILIALIAVHFDTWTCVIVATAGNFLGGTTTYGLGYLGKWKWIEKYFGKSVSDIEKFQHKIKKMGLAAALFAWAPIIGDIIALALGFLRFKPLPVFAMMLTGRFCRFVCVALLAEKFITNLL